MIKNLLSEFLSLFKSRIFIIGVIFVAGFLLLIVKLYSLQIIHGSDYENTFTYRIEKERDIDSLRGNILDRNGNILASNRLSYNITLEESPKLTNNYSYNSMLYTLIGLFQKYDFAFLYNIPIQMNENGEFIFTKNDAQVVNFKKDIFSILYTDPLNEEQKALTAEDMFNYMCSDKLFNISEEYPVDMRLNIAALRYEIYMKRYTKYMSIVLGKDANDQIIAAVKENKDILPGVTVGQEYIRCYTDSKFFSHITGYTAEITQEQIDEYSSQGFTDYKMGDIVGQTGIENLYETTLAGLKGSEKIYVDSTGSILETISTKEACAGSNITLSIDKEITERIYDLLERKIAGIILSKLQYTVDPGNEGKYIGLKDIYYALIDNNLIKLDKLEKDDASASEKAVYSAYVGRRDLVLNDISSYLRPDVKNPDKNLPEDYQRYNVYIYNYLKDNNILYGDMYPADDEVYAKWANKEINLGDFLMYAISQGYINTDVLSLVDQYSETAAAYNSLIDYLMEKLPQDPGFKKLIYYYMIYDGTMPGTNLCIALYDQGILQKDESYNRLIAGQVDPYSFIYNKIETLQIKPDMLALDCCSATSVVTDVKTGQIVAYVVYPGYDANRITEYDYYESIVNNKSNPLYNRGTRQKVAPGSTFKPITAVAALSEGIINTDTQIFDNVVFDKIFPSASCWSKISHGYVNVKNAIEVSCNYFFYELGYKMSEIPDNTTEIDNNKGLDTLRKYAEAFGLGQKSGIELYEEDPHISDEDSVRSAIGQGTHSYTTTQINRYTTALANKGTVFNLSLVQNVTSSEGIILQENNPTVINNIVLDDNIWYSIREGMRGVCANTEGYLDVFSSLDIDVAGKTGTAQESKDKPDHALMTGFAPYKNPQYAVTVLFPFGYGSSNIVDAFRDVIAILFNNELYNQEYIDKGLAIMPFNFFKTNEDDEGHLTDADFE